MNAFLVALLASAVVLVSARSTHNNNDLEGGLNGRLLTPDVETLKLLLSEQTNESIGGGNSKVPVGKLEYNLNRDFKTRVNPRNPNSDWTWLHTKDNKYAADNGGFLQDGISSVELAAVPLTKNAEGQTRLGLLSGYEAVLANKIKFVVEPEHKMTLRAVFSVKVKNVEDQPFGKTAVTNATDDPSLAAGGIALCSRGTGGLVFSIVATNTGIWAVYERNRLEMVEHPENGDKIFTIFHRLADRESTNEEIDAAITYDRSQNVVHYKLNNVVVFTLKNLGTLPTNEIGTLAHTITRPDLVRVEPKEFTPLVGIMSWLDAQDPNNKAHSLHNQRLTTDDVYDEKARFVDETGNKMYNTWGQGVIMKIHDIQIKLEESHGDDAKNELQGREGQKIESKVDGKLIVPSPTADLEELALINGERVPRIDNKQGEDDNEELVGNESDSVSPVEGEGEEDARQARKQVPPRSTARIQGESGQGQQPKRRIRQ